MKFATCPNAPFKESDSRSICNTFLGSFGHTDVLDRSMGLMTPWTFVPHHFLSYNDDLTYSQRFYNVILSVYDWWYREWIILPRQDEIAQRHFGHLVSEYEKKRFFLSDKERSFVLRNWSFPHICISHKNLIFSKINDIF